MTSAQQSARDPGVESQGKATRSPLDPFVQWFFPKLIPFVPPWVTPNSLSLAGAALALGAAVLLWFVDRSRWLYVAAAVLVLLTWATDTLDGMVARARGQTSRLGYYLDHFGDSVTGLALGVSMFATGGSHIEVGLVAAAFLLLLHVNAHVKAATLGRIEIPAFGPTEIRLLVVAVLCGEAFADYGQPGSWFSELAGDRRWLTELLGFRRGLTFIDLVGLLTCSLYAVLVPVEVAVTARRLARLDRRSAGAVGPRVVAAERSRERGSRAEPSPRRG
jgi:phosphatidylglycerophosphate synthase